MRNRDNGDINYLFEPEIERVATMRRGDILIRPIAVSVGFDHFKTDLNSI